MSEYSIRRETPEDYRAVEELTREAFWNVYKPGADEHYFVHQMRSKTPGSKYSSTSGLSPRGHLERQAEFHASTQDEA